MTATLLETAAPPVEMPRTRRRPTPRPWRSLWWTTPAGVLLLVITLSLLVTVTISPHDYVFFYRVQKAITGHDVFLFVLAAASLLIGTALPLLSGRQRPVPGWPGLDGRQLRTLDRAATVAFRLTVLGYVLLLGLGFSRGASPATLLKALTSQSDYAGTFKTVFAPVAGVTSLTQVGIAYVVLATLLRVHRAGRHTGRRLTVVFLLGLFRTYFLTERLAILELAVPLVLLAAVGARQRPRPSRRSALMPALPVLALPLLVVVFGAFEYSRSWQYFKTRTTLSFPQFAVNRLAGYYATSYNNGALILRYGSHLHRLPYDSIQGLWTSPGPAQLDLYHRLTGVNGPDVLNTVLAQHGNPEFNNPGGLASPLFDFGVPGGLLFFFVAGVLVGLAYRSFRSGRPVGLLIYPVLFTGLLELPRYVYWTEGRVVPAYLVLFVTAYLIRTRAPRRRASG
jgi:oligosaccharide repeat unit polymerase